MCLKRKRYFFLTDFGGGRDGLWEGPLLLFSPLFSSPLPGDSVWASLQDTWLWSPAIISIPTSFHIHVNSSPRRQMLSAQGIPTALLDQEMSSQ